MSGRATMRSAVLASAIVLAASSARAEDTNRVAAATLLFDEGVRALDAGRLAEACSKLAKSQELAPSGGTLLALGECHERAGRVASAWVAFRGAAARAAAAGKSDAEQDALEHAAKLEPKLARLTLKVVAPTPNLRLLRDKGVVTSSEISVAVPIDPGKHEIYASAPGSRSWTKTILITAGSSATIEVPALEPDSRESEMSDDPGKTQRTVAYVAGSVGLGALITGGVFGILAKSSNDRGEEHCNVTNPRLCTPQGIDLINRADGQATVSTVFFIVGAAFLVGGAVLYFTAPTATKHAYLDLSSATLRW